MHITPTYTMPASDEEKAENAKRMEEAAARRQREYEAEQAAIAKANGATVTLSETSLSALAPDDQRLRKNIRWGIVQGLGIWSLLMIPVVLILSAIIEAMK